MLMTLPEPTSPQDGETINLNLWFELTIVFFLKLTTFQSVDLQRLNIYRKTIEF